MKKQSSPLLLAATFWWIVRAVFALSCCYGMFSHAQEVPPVVTQNGEKVFSPQYRYSRINALSTSQVGTDSSCMFLWPDSGHACAISSNTFATGAHTSFYNFQYGQAFKTNTYGPGWNLGNDGGWRITKGINIDGIMAQRGIRQQFSLAFDSHGAGDSALIYGYHSCDGGVTGQSDEGCTLISLRGGETFGYFHGLWGAGGTSTVPKLTYVSGNNWTTDGAFLLDISKGTISGTFGAYQQVTALPNPWGSSGGQNGYLQYLPVSGVTLPLTASWCTVNVPAGADHAIPNPNTSASVGVSTTMNCTLQQIGGVAHPMTVGHACVAGNEYPEGAPITQVSAPVAGVQSIKVTVTNPAYSAVIFQGGVCEQFISLDADLATTGYRSSYYAFGSLTGSDLIYGRNIGGAIGVRGIPDVGGGEAASVQTGFNGFHLYPGAEIVMNGSTGANPTLAPNTVPWAVGDLVENPHSQTLAGRGAIFDYTLNSPPTNYVDVNGLELDLRGTGLAGPVNGIKIINYADRSKYIESGGPLSAPHMFRVDGSFGDFFDFKYAPEHSAEGQAAVVSILQTPNANNNAITLFDLPGANSSGVEQPHQVHIDYDTFNHVLRLEGAQIYKLRATTGTRFLCIDQYGYVTSSVTACSGT